MRRAPHSPQFPPQKRTGSSCGAKRGDRVVLLRPETRRQRAACGKRPGRELVFDGREIGPLYATGSFHE